MKPGFLIVVGTGHRLAGQITIEAMACIRQAQKVFHVCHPVTQAWIRQINPTEESLMDCYSEGKDRSETYEEMVERILAPVRSGLSVCVAFYGHPTVCADATRESVRRAREEGYRARILPGISAEDALLADLNIDPSDGCRSYEATDFLIRKRVPDTSSALILWQPGMIGIHTYFKETQAWNPRGIELLQEVLMKAYSPRHKAVVYEASPYPVCDPMIQEVALKDLSNARITTFSTIYIPPKKAAPLDRRMMKRLRSKSSPSR